MAKPFNKFAQDAMGMPPVPPQGDMGAAPAMSDEPSQQQQYSLGSLMTQMEQDPQGTLDLLNQHISPDAMIQWVSGDGKAVSGRAEEVLKIDNWSQMQNAREKASLIGAVYEQLPQNMRIDDMNSQDNTTIPAQQETANIPSAVAASNAQLKKLAAAYVKKHPRSSTFNLSKTAQSRVGQGNVVFGPSEQLFPSVNQIGNDWHISERNKGWGIKVQDMYGIDYEMVWRKYVMDKYNNAYQDKDGNWVGGYIQKRFEVDKNIPELNNMQYKPGQHRKPARATLIEGVLEESRGGKAFNWVKAKSQSAITTASAKEDTKFKKEQRKEKAGEGEGASDAELLSMKHAEGKTQKKKVAYAPEGQSANQQASNPKALNSQWACPQCNANNTGVGPSALKCVSCGATKPQGLVSKPTRPGIQNAPGVNRTNLPNMNGAPSSLKRNVPLQRQMSVNEEIKLSHIPKDDRSDKDDNDDETEEEEERDEDELFNDFKQLRSQPVEMDFARAALAAKDRRERSFNALAGF